MKQTPPTIRPLSLRHKAPNYLQGFWLKLLKEYYKKVIKGCGVIASKRFKVRLHLKGNLKITLRWEHVVIAFLLGALLLRGGSTHIVRHVEPYNSLYMPAVADKIVTCPLNANTEDALTLNSKSFGESGKTLRILTTKSFADFTGESSLGLSGQSPKMEGHPIKRDISESWLMVNHCRSIGISCPKNSGESFGRGSQSTTSTALEMTTGQRTLNCGSGQFGTAKEPKTLYAPTAVGPTAFDEPSGTAPALIQLKTLPKLKDVSYMVQTPVEPLWVDKRRPIGTYTNDYAPGNCTWYVASRLPIPNSMGNANNWAYAASIAGYTVSAIPQVGSIAQTGGDSYLGHVAIVESINPDGSFVVSEMNYLGLSVVDSRTTTTAEFNNFIYV